MPLREDQPTLFAVISGIPFDETKILFRYSEELAFHRGRQWFGTGMRVGMGAQGVLAVTGSVANVACPVGAAFGVIRDTSRSGWFSAKLDMNLLNAIRHIITIAGGEEGMEQYLKELENSDPVELHELITERFVTLSKI
jgi:hypothetical protein